MELINLQKQNKKLVERVKKALPAIDRHTRIFDRQNSQTTIQLMTLTMLGGSSPLRMLRQVTAEVEKRKNALYEAQHNVAKKQEEIDVLEEKQNLTSVEKAELIKLKHEVSQINNKANGSLKDIATLADAYDNIMSKNNMKDWNEEEFENENHVTCSGLCIDLGRTSPYRIGACSRGQRHGCLPGSDCGASRYRGNANRW